MADDFSGIISEPNKSTDIIKAVDTTPAPPKPEPPKPPKNWDTSQASYGMAHKARKEGK